MNWQKLKKGNFLKHNIFSYFLDSLFYLVGPFLRTTTPSHDDYGKTIGDIEKKFFAFNCQLKKLNEEILLS
jgi:hypothetical protein